MSRWLVCIAMLAVGGCSFVGSNSLNLPEPAACTSDLGAYYLPKHYVTIALERIKIPETGAWLDAKGKGAYQLFRFPEGNASGLPYKIEARPDPDYGFCLDYLATLSSNDRLTVERNKKGLLTNVRTKAQLYTAGADGDQKGGSGGEEASSNKTDLIAKRISQAAFTGLARRPICYDGQLRTDDTDLNKYCQCVESGKRDSQCAHFILGRPISLGRPETGRVVSHRGDFTSEPSAGTDPFTEVESDKQDRLAFSVDFDPTDPYEAAIFNTGLIAHDHCAFLGDGKVDLRSATEYCSDPGRYAQSRGFRPRAKPAASGSHEVLGFRPYKGGVLYRARVTYPFYIFKRDGKNWRLIQQQKVALANVGPIVSVGIDRALFADRNTEVEFEDGTLKKITIDKGSELEKFVGIPLALVTSIVKLPSQVLLLKIDQTTDTTELIRINKGIIEAQEAYNNSMASLSKAQDDAAAKGSPPTLDPDRRTKLLQACQSVLGPQQGDSALDTCKTIVDQSYNQ